MENNVNIIKIDSFNVNKIDPFNIENTEINYEQKLFELKEMLNSIEKSGLNIKELILKLNIELLEKWDEQYRAKALELLGSYSS